MRQQIAVVPVSTAGALQRLHFPNTNSWDVQLIQPPLTQVIDWKQQNVALTPEYSLYWRWVSFPPQQSPASSLHGRDVLCWQTQILSSFQHRRTYLFLQIFDWQGVTIQPRIFGFCSIVSWSNTWKTYCVNTYITSNINYFIKCNLILFV